MYYFNRKQGALIVKSRCRRGSVKKERTSGKNIIDNLETVSDNILLDEYATSHKETKLSVEEELELDPVDLLSNPVDISEFLQHLPPTKQNRRTSFLLNVTSIDQFGMPPSQTFRWMKSLATQQGIYIKSSGLLMHLFVNIMHRRSLFVCVRMSLCQCVCVYKCVCVYYVSVLVCVCA